ncbi:universal stress protein [Natrinema salaciae]|uniref:Nucleotide-binding universal stress protein, UspA family n=1 Tax=Natrinema salaciae TaxID=1186196 RepID=A0A1H9ST24_9EURY|nr:universal stress protein [Natrinema salaciae]SER87479.1 Nucleotide-binding universal stress protein, UspA family [Natrinema salaciae]
MASRILVALDESPQARAAFRHALSTYPDAEIHVLHVNDPREWSSSDGMGGFYSEDAYERTQQSAEQLLDEAAEIAREYDAAVTTNTTVGKAAPGIVRYAEEHDVDHIVLGSHGRRGLSRFLLGSVAERVARRSPGSVTIVREEQSDREA